jgi:hypothetical protein
MAVRVNAEGSETARKRARWKVMEHVENSSANRTAFDTRSPRLRSRVTNGKTPFVEADGRGPWSRRWRDVLAEITNDLGGADLLSEGQRQLIRRATTISIACERMEGEAAAGAEIDLELYGRLVDRLGRAFQRLGLKRQPRDVTPTLSEYLAALRQSEAEANKQAIEEGGASREAVHE